MPLTPAQIELRRAGITATDVSALVGLSPYKSALEVYADKTGQSKPIEENEAMRWGNVLEPIIAQRYADENEIVIWQPDKTTQNEDDPWMMCTPDCLTKGLTLVSLVPTIANHLVVVGDGYGVEVKTAGSARQVARWGKAGDDVPEEYIIQCQWSMVVCGVQRWDMAVLLAGYHGFEYRQYTLERNDKLIGILKDRAWAFLENVRKGIKPTPDGSQSARRAFDAIYAHDDGTDMPPTDEMRDLAVELKAADKDLKDAQHEREALQQQFKALLGESQGVRDFGWKVTWRADKRGKRIFRTHFS